MGYERLRVVKPLKQLIKALELYTRHVAKDNRGQWRDAKMVVYNCFGNLIRAAEEWETSEKNKYLMAFLDEFAVFRGMMQVLEESHIVSNKKASEIALYAADIKKQVSGWRKEIVRDSVPPRLDGESHKENEKDCPHLCNATSE